MNRDKRGEWVFTDKADYYASYRPASTLICHQAGVQSFIGREGADRKFRRWISLSGEWKRGECSGMIKTGRIFPEWLSSLLQESVIPLLSPDLDDQSRAKVDEKELVF